LTRTLAAAGVLGGASYDGLVALQATAHDQLLLTFDGRAQQTYQRLRVSFQLVPARLRPLLLIHPPQPPPPRPPAPPPAAAGGPLDERVPRAGDELPGLDEVSGILSLGGSESVTELDRYPYLHDEVALLRQAVDAAVPVLGICLGGQLLAHATGGSVRHAG